MGAEEDLFLALGPVVEAAGLEIWDVERSGTSVRVWVDGPDGADLEVITRVTGAISAALDGQEAPVPAGRYTLEVSSPGLERRLRYPRHFARYLGREVAVKTAAGSGLPRRVHGTLLAASEEAITVRAELAEGESEAGTGIAEGAEVRVPIGLLDRANAVFSWGSPGTTRRTGPKRRSLSRSRAATAGTNVAATSNLVEGAGQLGGGESR